jgi:nicotinamide mononucleotide transporter
MISQFSNLFDINSIFFTVLDYPISYVEFVGTVAGLISVWLAAKSSIWTWATGLVNVVCFFVIFYQVQLYSDMFLQAYFFAMSIYGWIIWGKQDKKEENPITTLSNKSRIYFALIIVFSTVVFGTLMLNIHTILPSIFAKPASFPYLDTFTTVLSILATIFLAKRIFETWILWIVVDILSIGLYATKGIMLISIEYVIFLGLASYGFYNWYKLQKDEKRIGLG